MNQVDQNINKDMIESDLIDVESLDFSDDQTWLYRVPDDSGSKVDIVDLSCDWPIDEDDDYQQLEKKLNAILDDILKNEVLAMPDKHIFDSRTYVRPKKRPQRPSIQSIIQEVSSNNATPHNSLNQSANKYLTYNKYSMPLGPISPMLRLKTFNVDANTDNSHSVKEYAMKRKSLVQDDDPQLEDLDVSLASEVSDRLSSEHAPSRPINIDLSQPAHNLHNTFNKGLTNIMNERGSLNMYQSGESLMRMSPPSLVSSLLMESSGNFNAESLDSRKSISAAHRDSGVPQPGRESIDPMMTSMTLSILDEKDMSTSFLSQTTYPDNDSFMDSLPPSLVSSVNSSYLVSNTSKAKAENTPDSNVFSSVTFTNLEKSEKLLSARPRYQLYNSFTKRDSGIRNSESYTKSREEACQIDTTKILNENSDKKDTNTNPKPNPEMAETITLHFSNTKFRGGDAEKENLNATFENDDTFYKDMGIQRTVDLARNSMNVTLDKQELNEIIQARQKLSLARKALPTEEKPPNQVDTSPIKTIQLPNQTITVPRQSMENASELLSRRRAMNGGFDKHEEPTRETPKRNATFKKVSPKTSAMDTTVVYVKADETQNIIDINSATMNLIDTTEQTLVQEEWGSQERAMVGSSESTDTGTFSSSSPPESVPESNAHDPRAQIASTPLMTLKKGAKINLLNLHSTISPIYDLLDDKSYDVTKAQLANGSGMERTYDMHNTTVINSATLVKKPSAKRDILAGRASPEKRDILAGRASPEKRSMVMPQTRSPPCRISPTNSGLQSGMAPPLAVPRKTGLPTSKFRQYSSHRELSRIPGNNVPNAPRPAASRTMVRRGVYASNPVLSPTNPTPPVRRDSYTVAADHALMNAQRVAEEEKPAPKPVMTAPPPLVRQGTETLRRERPLSQLVAPRDLRASGLQQPAASRNHPMPPPVSRPYSIAGTQQLRVSRPTSVPPQRPAPAPVVTSEPRPASSSDGRASALPRPSRLPAPRRALRPPSVYSVAPAADADHY